MTEEISLGETLPSDARSRRRSRRASDTLRNSPRSTPRPLSNTATSPLADTDTVGNVDIVLSSRSSDLSQSTDRCDIETSPDSTESGDVSRLNLSNVGNQSCENCNTNKTEQFCVDRPTDMCNSCIQNDIHPTGDCQTTLIPSNSNTLTIPSSDRQPIEEKQGASNCDFQGSSNSGICLEDNVSTSLRKSTSLVATKSDEKGLSDVKRERIKLSEKLKDNLFNLRRYRLQNDEKTLQKHLDELVQSAMDHKNELIEIIERKHQRLIDKLHERFESVFEMIRLCDKRIEKTLLDIQAVEEPKIRDENFNPKAQIERLKRIEERNDSECKDFDDKFRKTKAVVGLMYSSNKKVLKYLKENGIGTICSGKDRTGGVSESSLRDDTGLDIDTNTLQTIESIGHGQNNIPSCETVKNAKRSVEEGHGTSNDCLRYISCWTEGDYGSKTCITDMVKTKQGTILIADHGNKKLKLLRVDGEESDVCGSIDVGGEPWQIAPYTDNKYVVTVIKEDEPSDTCTSLDQTGDLDENIAGVIAKPRNSSFKQAGVTRFCNNTDEMYPACVIVDALGYLSIYGSFRLPKEATGIAVCGDTFIFCGYNEESAHIFQTNERGQLVSETNYCGKTRLKRPNYLCISQDCSVLYVSDADRGVFGLRTDNLEILFRVKDKIKCPLGMTLDHNGDLIVCASQSHALYRITKDGGRKGASKVGLRGLQSVCLINKTSVIVSSDAEGYALVLFQMTER